MKARLPFEYDYSANGRRKNAIASAMLLFAKAICEAIPYITAGDINKWAYALDAVTVEAAGYNHSGFFNREWTDEMHYWAEQNDLKIPDNYRMHIAGEPCAYGTEQSMLPFIELFALTRLGFGKDRLHRVWDKYAEISKIYSTGNAKYSAKELRDWADEKKIMWRQALIVR